MKQAGGSATHGSPFEAVDMLTVEGFFWPGATLPFQHCSLPLVSDDRLDFNGDVATRRTIEIVDATLAVESLMIFFARLFESIAPKHVIKRQGCMIALRHLQNRVRIHQGVWSVLNDFTSYKVTISIFCFIRPLTVLSMRA